MADTTLSFNVLARDNASATIAKVGSRFGDLHLSVGKVMKGLVAVGPALAGLAIGAGLKDFINDARESAKVGRLTESVIKSTGGAAKITADQVGALATAISNKTGADDEAVQSGENLLLTFTNIRNGVGKGNQIFNQATQAITDMTAALNDGQVTTEGIKASSIQLGKALNDPIKGVTALQKVGVSFTADQKKQIKTLVDSGKMMQAQKIILGELNKEFGGAAAAASDPMQKLGVIIGNAKETIGGAFLPIVDKVATSLGRAIPAAISKASVGFSALSAAFHGEGITSNGFVGVMERIGVVARRAFGIFKSEVLPHLKDFGGFVRGDVIPALVQFGGFVKTQITANVIPAVRNLVAVFKPLVVEVGTTLVGAYRKLVPPVTGLGKTIATGIGPALKRFTGFLKEHGTTVRAVAVGVGAIVGAMLIYKGVVGAVAIATKAYAAVQAALNFVMSANPIGVVVLALVGLAAGLVYAYKHSEKFREIVNKLGGALKTAFLGVVGFVKDTIKFFHDLPGNVTKALGDTAKLLLKKGQDFITGLMNGIWSIAKGIDKWMLRAPVAKLLAPWYGAARWLIPHGIKFLTGFLQGVAGVAKTVGGWLMRNVINPMVGAFGRAGSWLIQRGRDLVSGLLNGVVAYMRAVKGIGTWLYNNVIVPAVLPFAKANLWLVEHGKHLIGGLFSGVAAAMKNIGSWVKGNIVDPIVKAVKWFFGIKSPSKVFADIGGHLVSGLFKGMGSGVGGAIAKKVFGDMPSALRAIVGKGLISVKNLPKKALDALGGAIGIGQPLGGPAGNEPNEGVVRTLAAQYGWATGAQWSALRSLIMGESGFNNTAQNPNSSAYGLFQFLDSTWGSVGGSKTSDPWQQTILGLRYIARSYGDPANAFSKWSSRSPHWYANGGVIAEHVLGVGLRSGRPYHIGENGPERVTPMGRGGQTVTLRIESGGSRMDDFIAELIRRYVRVNGGDVQKVLGK